MAAPSAMHEQLVSVSCFICKQPTQMDSCGWNYGLNCQVHERLSVSCVVVHELLSQIITGGDTGLKCNEHNPIAIAVTGKGGAL